MVLTQKQKYRSMEQDGKTRDKLTHIWSAYSFFIYKFIIFGCIGSLLLHVGAFSSCSEQGPLSIVVCGLLIAVASLAVEHRL